WDKFIESRSAAGATPGQTPLSPQKALVSAPLGRTSSGQSSQGAEPVPMLGHYGAAPFGAPYGLSPLAVSSGACRPRMSHPNMSFGGSMSAPGFSVPTSMSSSPHARMSAPGFAVLPLSPPPPRHNHHNHHAAAATAASPQWANSEAHNAHAATVWGGILPPGAGMVQVAPNVQAPPPHYMWYPGYGGAPHSGTTSPYAGGGGASGGGGAWQRTASNPVNAPPPPPHQQYQQHQQQVGSPRGGSFVRRSEHPSSHPDRSSDQGPNPADCVFRSQLSCPVRVSGARLDRMASAPGELSACALWSGGVASATSRPPPLASPVQHVRLQQGAPAAATAAAGAGTAASPAHCGTGGAGTGAAPSRWHTPVFRLFCAEEGHGRCGAVWWYAPPRARTSACGSDSGGSTSGSEGGGGGRCGGGGPLLEAACGPVSGEHMVLLHARGAVSGAYYAVGAVSGLPAGCVPRAEQYEMVGDLLLRMEQGQYGGEYDLYTLEEMATGPTRLEHIPEGESGGGPGAATQRAGASDSS
ncbi:hypothetical protein FOA52_009062, partial [Chlamydomonas sp. UWO 241]